MKVSLNWLRKYTTVDLSIDEVVEKIGAQLGGVDEVINLGKKYQGIVIAKVVSCEKHSNADKLQICKIDDGGKVKDVKRDESGYVQVVCGAPNVREGLMVAWLPPGITVPVSLDKEPLSIEAKDFRGQTSNGMLASLKELGISDDHSGILEIDPQIPSAGQRTNSHLPKPGDDFARFYGLDDYVIDIENKMFTHRPDLFGMLGIARELAGIQGMAFHSPDWYWKLPVFEAGEGLKIEVTNESPQKVSRFMAVTQKNVKVKPSPLWLQIELARLGSKPINNVVDVTNYIMLLTAQPVHAYDYDKLKGHKLISRLAKTGESVKLLNGKTYELDKNDIVIADAEGPVGLAGIMGGNESEVSSETKNVVLEVATFDMYALRRSSMRYGLFTDALTRFTKGQSPLQNDRALYKLIEMLKGITGAEQAGHVVDLHQPGNVYDTQTLSGSLNVESRFINERLGLRLSDDEISTLLRNVNFACYAEENGKLQITAPFWRTDIDVLEDIVEEVGRLYGYDRLPVELPKRSIVPAGPDGMLRLKQTLREILASFGANELLTYSFVHGDLLSSAGQDKDEAYKIANALSPNLQYYRLTITPSLLAQLHPNVKAGHDNFALFELGKMHTKKQEDTKAVPKEIETLAFVITDADKKAGERAGAAFYQARHYLDQLAHKLGLELVYYPVERDPGLAIPGPFDLKRSAFVTIKDSKGMLGIVGEYSAATRKNLKLPPYSSGFEVGIEELLAHTDGKNSTAYKSLSRYPGTWQDICFQVSPKTTYKQVYETVQKALAGSPLQTEVRPIDIYQPQTGGYKNITLRVSLTNHAHTITAEETNLAITKITDLAKSQLKAKIV